ncbi:MAG: DNA-binding protein [Thermofilaceae archaeon]
MVFKAVPLENVYLLSIFPEEDVLESILSFVESEGINNAIISAGYGTLSEVRLHWITSTAVPPDNHFQRLRGPYELLSLQGIIVNKEPHIHAVVSINGRAFGGHLEVGCKVLYLCEVAVQKLCSETFLRRLPNKCGVRQINFE